MNVLEGIPLDRREETVIFDIHNTFNQGEGGFRLFHMLAPRLALNYAELIRDKTKDEFFGQEERMAAGETAMENYSWHTAIRDANNGYWISLKSLLMRDAVRYIRGEEEKYKDKNEFGLELAYLCASLPNRT